MPLYYVSERVAEKSPVLHGLLTAQTYFYVFLVFSSFDGADHCTDHIMAVFICEGGEIKLKDIIVGHVEGNGLCIHTWNVVGNSVNPVDVYHLYGAVSVVCQKICYPLFE